MEVLHICMEVHMNTIGSADTLTSKEMARYIRCLQWLQEHWQPSYSAFDRGVRLLVDLTLVEHRETVERSWL